MRARISRPGPCRNARARKLHLKSQSFNSDWMFREGDPRRDLRQKSIHHNRRFVRPPAINRRSGHARFFRDALQCHSPESVLLKQAQGRLEDVRIGMLVSWSSLGKFIYVIDFFSPHRWS